MDGTNEDAARELVARVLDATAGLSAPAAARAVGVGDSTIRRWRKDVIGPLRGGTATAVRTFLHQLEYGGPVLYDPDDEFLDVVRPEHMRRLVGRTKTGAYLEALYDEGRRKGWPEDVMGAIARYIVELARAEDGPDNDPSL